VTAIWRCGGTDLSLDRPLVMGVVNVTPDSFSDGGVHFAPDAAVAHAHRLVAEGCDVVDVGGESTRPGAAAVDAAEEERRVLPVVTRLAADGLVVSVDTRRAALARRALQAGAAIVNDVSAGRDDVAMFDVCARAAAGVVVMHMRGTPRTMQDAPVYDDVVAEVATFLRERADAARTVGCPGDAIAVDPGIGFGKTLAHNLALLAATDRIAALGYPVVVGVSRKSMFATLLGLEVHERLDASLAAAVWAVLRGAAVVRVHDVAATRAALDAIDV
jgi:dihydropteroate synthase